MTKKITSLLLILIILSFSMFSFATTKDELNAEKKDLQNKIDEAEDRIDDIEGSDYNFQLSAWDRYGTVPTEEIYCMNTASQAIDHGGPHQEGVALF